MNNRLNQLQKLMLSLWTKGVIQWRSCMANISKRLHELKSQLTQIRRLASASLATKIVIWRLHTAFIVRRSCAWLGYVAVILFGITIAAVILFVPQVRSVVDAFNPIEAILSQLGAIFGTILALVLTLSIIPIQRAGEVWSPSIMHLYRRDPATYVTFVALGVFCVASFLFAVRGLADMSVRCVLSGALIVLSISLDLLRWYHRHICRLLEPTHATNMLLCQANRTIDRICALVTSVAKAQYKFLISEQKERITIEDLETRIFPQVARYPDSINDWINDLAEIATKAVARGERYLAMTAVYAIANVANHYLSARKQNLVVSAVGLLSLATESDTKIVTDCVYEALKDVSRAAISQGDESTAIHVSRAYQSIAIHTANLGARAFQEHAAPLTAAPIFYAFECVKFAQTKSSDEVPFQSAALLSEIASVAPKDVANTDINIRIIDGLYSITTYLYGKGCFLLAEEIIGYQFTILAYLIQREDYYFKEALSYVLKKIEQLARLSIYNEALAGRLNNVYPLSKAYGLVNPTSLGYLFGIAAKTLLKIDPERDWLNPYRDLIDIADVIGGHLRNIAENNEFGESFLIWEIDHLIRHIAKVITELIDKPLRPGRGDEEELVDKFGWILSFYWVAFKGKKTISVGSADDCGDSLAFIGLLFYERRYSDILRSSISSIHSILESYCEITQQPDYYLIGDMLAHLWGIRLLLVARNDHELIQEVDRMLSTKPRTLTDEQWKGTQDAILLRRRQLEEDLGNGSGWSCSDDAENLLRRLLRKS